MTEKSELKIPQVHLSGTTGPALIAGYLKAANAIGKAIEATGETWPHARDYYLQQDPDAQKKATTQHQDRMRRLRDVQQELQWLAEGVDAQSR